MDVDPPRPATVLALLLGLAVVAGLALLAGKVIAPSPHGNPAPWGYVETNGAFVIPPTFDAARGFSEGLAAVESQGRWGWIDKTGKWVIPPRFAKAREFHDGFAPAYDDDAHRWGYVDKTGKWVVKPQWVVAMPFAHGVAPVGQRIDAGGSLAQGVYGYGLVDATGKMVVPVAPAHDPNRWQDLRPFSDGVAVVAVRNLYGFVRPDGSFAVPPTFQDLGKMVDELAPAEQDSSWGYIGPSGTWVIPPRYLEAQPFSEGWAVVRDQNGFLHIDEHGEPAYEGHFAGARPRTGGYAAVKARGKWGFIDAKTGHMLVPPIWPAVSHVSFSGGHGLVVRATRAGNVWGWVDPSGGLGPRWYLEVDQGGFSEGLLAVRVRVE